MYLMRVQDYSQTPPAQELIAKDLHGNEWKFRHIFRGEFSRITLHIFLQFYCLNCKHEYSHALAWILKSLHLLISKYVRIIIKISEDNSRSTVTWCCRAC